MRGRVPPLDGCGRSRSDLPGMPFERSLPSRRANGSHAQLRGQFRVPKPLFILACHALGGSEAGATPGRDSCCVELGCDLRAGRVAFEHGHRDERFRARIWINNLHGEGVSAQPTRSEGCSETAVGSDAQLPKARITAIVLIFDDLARDCCQVVNNLPISPLLIS
jgi:hypothetical protein